MTKEILVELLNVTLKQEQDDYEEYLMLRDIMKQFVGKKLTRRVGAKLPEGFRYDIGYNGPEIRKGRDRSHYLCYGSEANNFTLEAFENRNTPYSKGSKERAEKLLNIISSEEKLVELLHFYNKCEYAANLFLEIKNFGINSFENPAYYDIRNYIMENSELAKYDRETVEKFIKG